MAALNFPNSPSTNDTYTANNISYTWNGTAWKKTSSGITDGDKGDITVSNSGDTFTVDDAAITTTKIADDAITDAKLANSINSAIAANTAKVTNATHFGDVTGSTGLTIANDAVSYAKIQNVSTTDRVLGRNSSGAGDVEELTPGNLRTMLNVADGAEVNVQANWNSSSGDSQILNKPTIPSNIGDLNNVSSSTPSTNQVLKWNGSAWAPAADNTSSGSGTTDLSNTANGTSLTIESSSGNNTSLPAATTSAWGVMTDDDKTALDSAILDGDFTSNGFMKRTGAGSYTVDTNTYLTSIPSSYLQNLSEDTTPQLGGNLDVQSNEINTSTTDANIILNPNGAGVVEVKGDGTSNGNVGTLQLNCSNNNHGVKIKSPPHSASASYTLTLPNTDGNANQVLKTDGSGGLDWVDQASGGATDKISEGNTEAETVDTGSDGHFKVTTEGTERLRVIADGKVGIGTTTPGELLQVYAASGHPRVEVKAASNNDATLKLTNDNGNWQIFGGGAAMPLKFYWGGSGSNVAMTMLTSGNVGIGTTSPSTVLEVNGSFKAGGLAYPTSDGSANQVLKTDGSGTLSFVDQSGGGGGGGLSSDSQYNTVGGTNAGDSFTGTDAEGNTLIGYDAGTAITTADDNTCLGFDAGKALTTGGSNTFVGAEVGETCTTGYQNICVGRRSGQSLTTGFNNIFIGRQAGQNTTEGNDNVSIGTYALLNNQTGIRNTVVGSNSGRAITTGTESCFFGAYAGYSLTTGSHNNSFGYQAGYSLISGAHNNFYGKQSGYNCTTGHRNTGYGNNTLLALTTGQRNTGIGYSSGKDLTTGYYNTFLGYYAGNNTTTGENNICIGYQATTSSATVDNEVTIGDSNITKFRVPGIDVVLKDNGGTPTQGHVLTVDANGEAGFAAASGGGGLSSDSRFNVLGGTDAGGNLNLSHSTSYVAGYNVFLGHEAGKTCVTGYSNTAVGYQAFYSAQSVSHNTAFGRQALYTNNGGEQLCAFGSSALYNATAGNNSGFGYLAGNNITSGTNNTCIGHTAYASSATVSNEITLGNSSVTSLRCADTSISSLSDRRDKTDIVDLPVGLDFINSLKPRQFKWQTREGVSTKDGTVRAGFIAQELQEAQTGAEYLDLVYDSNPDQLEVKQGKLIPVLVKAIQELSAKVTALEAG